MQINHPQNPTTLTPPPLPPSGGDYSKARDEEFWNRIPMGYKFRPTDEEIIVGYLMKKINNEALPPNMIHVVNIYAFTPDQLSERFRPSGVKEWFFFTPRGKKYKNGHTPNRTAGDGHWKAICAKKHIMHDGEIIGSRRKWAYKYNKGTPQTRASTDWLMHEFTVRNSSTTQVNTMRLDDWVMCKGTRKIVIKGLVMWKMETQHKREPEFQESKAKQKITSMPYNCL